MRKVTLFFILSALAVSNIAMAALEDGASRLDARLSQKITYTAECKTVSSILADLTDLSKVKLYAGYNNNDWQVRDRKMNIFANDIALSDLMTSIARVMKFKWMRSEKGDTFTYRLFMDRKTLISAERNRLLEEQQLNAWEQGQRESLLSDLEKASKMSDAELENLKADDPELYVYSRLGWPALIPMLLSAVPAAKEAWINGDEIDMNAKDLPLEVQQGLIEWMQAHTDFDLKIYGKSGFSEPLEKKDVDGIKINFNMARKLVGHEEFFVDVTIHPKNGSGNQTAFCDRSTENAKQMAWDYINALESENPIGGQRHSQMNQQHLAQIQAQYTDIGEPAINHPDDPELMSKITMYVGGPNLNDVLAALAESSGFSIVSDSFYRRFRGLDFSNEEITLRKVLDKIATQCRYNWERQSNVLEFRDRDWFRKRAFQIPESWLEPWRKHFRENETLDLDDLSQIAALDEKQFWDNILPDDILGTRKLAEINCFNGYLLRLYGSLTDQQRQMLFAPTGLDVALLDSRQRLLAEKFFAGNPAFSTNPDIRINLSGTRSAKEKLFEYEFRAAADDLAPMEWNFTTPTYVPPKPPIARKIDSLPWTGSGKKALDVFNEAKKLELVDDNVWLQLGLKLYDGKYYLEALEAFKKGGQTEKSAAILKFTSLVWQGHILDLLDRREEALECYKKASKIDIGEGYMKHSQYKMIINKEWVKERLKTSFERN